MSREMRRKESHTTPRVGSSPTVADKGLPEVTESFLNHDVATNYLVESPRFSGFTYLMRTIDNEQMEWLKKELFPSLSVALESSLQRAVSHQLGKEAHLQRRQSLVTAAGKVYRGKTTLPDGEIEGVNGVRLLAEELKRIVAQRHPNSS